MAINRKYVYVDDKGVFTYAQTPLKYNGHLYGNPKERHYREAGAFPFRDERPKGDETHRVEETKYADIVDGVAVRRYKVREVEVPPRTFSKLRAIAALKQAGVWAQVKAWIEANDLYDEYLAAQDFREDNEYFVRGLGALKAQLGWSDEQVEAVLSACVAEGV